MTITIDDLFKHSYVISIDDARIEILKKTFGHGQLPIPKTYQGFQFKKYRQRKYQNQDFQEIPVSPILNCAYSHASIIKLAKELDWPYVCIFEDDAYPCYDIKTKLEFYLKDIPDDCECLLLGNNGNIKCGPYNNDFIRILSMRFGTHAYVIFKSGYDKILNNYNMEYAVSDLVYNKMTVYSPQWNLFIQYNQKQGMNGSSGYIWYGRRDEQIFREFPRFEMIKEAQNEQLKDRRRVVAMASFPPRKEGMISAIKQLLPQCDDFYLWLNEYEQIPEELKQFDQTKLHITLSKENLKECGRYTFIEQNKDSYLFICDDDVDWPEDYVEHTIQTLKQYNEKCVCAYYVKTSADMVNENRFDRIIDNSTNWTGIHHYMIGFGTASFVPEKIGWYPDMQELNAHYDQEPILTDHLHRNQIPVVLPNHRKDYLIWKKKDNGKWFSDDSTALSKTGYQNRVQTLKYMRTKSNVH